MPVLKFQYLIDLDSIFEKKCWFQITIDFTA